MPAATGGGSLVVATVDGTPVHAGDVYRLLALNFPDDAGNAARQVVRDLVAGAEAAADSIAVPAAAVTAETDRVLADQARKVSEGSKGQETLESYVQATYGMDRPTYQALVRTTVERMLLLERVVLFELSRHPRIQLRLIRVAQKSLAEEIRKKLEQGADFAALARQSSEDGSARDGGVYPPLPADLPSPLFAETGARKEGEVGPVEEVSTRDGPRYRIVQVLARLPAEGGTWAERGPALEQVLAGRPLSPLELEAWMRVMEQKHTIRILPLGALDHGS
jgi:hypothetical protein